jgi:phage baseplate assembly protein gpV
MESLDGTPLESEEMQILQRNTVKCQTYNTYEEGEHVLVLFLGNGLQEGIILGSLYTEENLPKYPAGDGDLISKRQLYRVQHDDNSYFEFDLNKNEWQGYVNKADLTFAKMMDDKLSKDKEKTSVHIRVEGDEATGELTAFNPDTEIERLNIKFNGKTGTIDLIVKDESGAETATVHMDGSGKSIDIMATEFIKASCKDASVTAQTIDAKCNVATVTCGDALTIKAPTLTIESESFTIKGNLSVDGNISNIGDMQTSGKHTDIIGGHV